MKMFKNKLIVFFLIVFSFISFAQERTSRTFTIAANDSVGIIPTIDGEGWYISGLKIPALTTGTTSLSFLVADDTSDYDPLWYDGSLYSITIDTTGISCNINIQDLAGWDHLKVVLSKKQTAKRTFVARYNNLR